MENSIDPSPRAQLKSDEAEKYRELRWLARELCQYFPNLDLRFNIQEGRPSLHCSVPSLENIEEKNFDKLIEEEEIPEVFETLELNLDEFTSEELLFDAIFSIKQIAQLFDA